VNIYIQIGIALATILGSGVVSAMVNHHFTTAREEREFRRKKVEALFLAFHGYCSLLTSRNLVWPKVMDGSIDYNKALDLTRSPSEKDYAHFETVEMLVMLYFPALEPAWKGVLKVRDRINSIQSDFKHRYEVAGPDSSFIRPFCEAVLSLDKVEESFKEQLTLISRQI
jgi:hypothetical protein